MHGKRAIEAREHAFAYKVALEGKTHSDAFREAWPGAEYWKDKSVHTGAWQINRKPEVQRIMNEITTGIRTLNQVTPDAIVSELEDAQTLAKENGQAGAHVQATMGKAKVAGLLVDKTQELTSVADVAKLIDSLADILELTPKQLETARNKLGVS